jgi:hypothetical protein
VEAGTTGLVRKIHVVVIQISRLSLGLAASWYSWDRSRLTGYAEVIPGAIAITSYKPTIRPESRIPTAESY